MDLAPGSSPPSGNEPKKSQRVNWKQIAQSLQIEVEKLQGEIKLLREEHASVVELRAEMKVVGWGPRHKVMLNCLEHFYSRVLNSQTHCDEDKEYLDELVKDVQNVIQKRLKGETR